MEKKSSSAILGVLLIGLGATFLLTQLFNISLFGFLWPFFVIVPGALFFVGMVLIGKKGAGLAIPGSIVTMTGLLLLYQNTFNHWESWAYAWALIMPTSIGVGLMIMGAWTDMDKLIKSGMRLAAVGVALFCAGGFIFEVIFNISGNRIAGFAWPIALIGIGLYLLNRKSEQDDTKNAPFKNFEPLNAERYAEAIKRDAPPPTEPEAEKQTEFRPLDINK